MVAQASAQESRINWKLQSYWWDCDEYRRWHGRGKSFQSFIVSLDEDLSGNGDTRLDSLGREGFEETLVSGMDVREALSGLSRFQLNVLKLKAAGYSLREIAMRLSSTECSVQVTLSQARKKVRAYCAV